MQPIVTIIHLLTCVSLIALVLIQQGKGADIGAAFGSGASNTVFGSPGASSFLFKLTAVLAAIFFATSLALGYLASAQTKQQSNLDLPAALLQQQSAPVDSAAPAGNVPATTPVGSQSSPLGS
jgi:preprotein translocase subunit SecG